MKNLIAYLLCSVVLTLSVTVTGQRRKPSEFFRILTNGHWGFIDKSGKMVIEPRFDFATEFSEGLAAVEISDKWGFIDKSGAFSIRPRFGQAYSFSEGLAVIITNVKKDNPATESLPKFPIVGNYGFIDRSGKVVIKPQFKWAGDFSAGLAPVEINEKYGFIDRNRKIVITPRFDFADTFSDGLAVVAMGKKFGYIDATGKVVIKPGFDDAMYFNEGLAAIRIGPPFDGRYGYIDRIGKIVIEPQFGRALFFSGGLADVSPPVGEEIKGTWGYIEKSGNLECGDSGAALDSLDSLGFQGSPIQSGVALRLPPHSKSVFQLDLGRWPRLLHCAPWAL